MSEKLDAAVLHQHAGARQHAAGAEFPVERLDAGDDEAAPVGGAHPHGVAGILGERPARRLAADLHRLAGEEARIEIAVERVGQVIGIGDDPVAHPQRALRRLDQAVDVVEAFRLGDASRANSARIISEAMPWVGASVL